MFSWAWTLLGSPRKEVFMPYERFLPFCGHEVLEALWEVLPESRREERVPLLAELIQRAARETACKTKKELPNESHPC